MSDALQDRHAPDNICFGCGPKNDKGLRIKSRVDGDDLVCDFQPEPHHQAFPGVLNGGIIGSLLDCHCNWAASWSIMQRDGLDSPPCTVTAEYTVKMRRPTPAGQPVHLRARAVTLDGSKATIEGELLSGGKICATCTGVFVQVKPGHPAYHRW